VLRQSPLSGIHEKRFFHKKLSRNCPSTGCGVRTAQDARPRAPAATKGACTGGKARWGCDHPRIAISTTAPGLPCAIGTSEYDILWDRPVWRLSRHVVLTLFWGRCRLNPVSTASDLSIWKCRSSDPAPRDVTASNIQKVYISSDNHHSKSK
jgi:hypothetical protein